MLVTVNTDGSYYPETGRGGYAFWISSNVGTFKGYGKLRNCPGSTEAELMAIANALHYLRHNKEIVGVTKIIINTDCESLINVINNSHTNRKPSINKVRGAISHYIGKWQGKDSDYDVRHVKAHKKVESAREYVNDWLDKHAKIGANL